MKVVYSEGNSQEDLGFGLGCQLAEAIKHNIDSGMKDAESRGVDQRQLKQYADQYMNVLNAGTLDLMEGLSQGSRVPFSSILYFNVIQDWLCTDGCTTFAAIGKGTASGGALLLKNRDVPANSPVRGRYHYENRQINVVQVLKNPDGNITVGVATAGSTGIVMGLNTYGVATASNQGRTKEFKPEAQNGRVGNYRGQLMREGLEHHTAKDAVKHVLNRLIQIKTENPGILWFVDDKNIYVIEVAPQEFSVQHVTDGFTVRANHFILLDQLNDENISCVCRYFRGRQMLEENYGNIDREKMVEFSMDHTNGPGESYICKHSRDERGSVTESAAIMEVNSQDPKKSRISIALGSPCWAWRSRAGNITFQIDDGMENIPKRFLDGSVYKEFIKEEPWEEAGT